MASQRLILEAVKTEEAEHQEGSWDGEVRRGGSGEVARVGSVAEALSCAISLKMIAFRSQGVELRDLTLCV